MPDAAGDTLRAGEEPLVLRARRGSITATEVQETNVLLTTARGRALLADPLLNKDSAFVEEERDAFGLHGLLPARVLTMEEQAELELEHVRRKEDDLERYIGLAALQDRNETLFYRVLAENLEELLPIVYTPTVGLACQRFSHILRRTRGLWLTPEDEDRVPILLRNAARGEVRLIVATDNERILGLGDQGCGGMGIPIGKLSLYTACAGVPPALTLPVSLDVGTDNETLLSDPLYLGYRRPRLRGRAYDRFLDAFVEGVRETFPRALLQWEDLKKHNAVAVLDRYRHRFPSFNDDVQGTGAVVLAGVLAALRRIGGRLEEHRFVIVGAGAAGIGIARTLSAAMRRDGVDERIIRRAIVMTDLGGLLYLGRPDVSDEQEPFALGPAETSLYGISAVHDLVTIVGRIRPTFLIGATAEPGVFTEAVIREMGGHATTPVVFPLSNPTSSAEAIPADVVAWTGGRALVATGSPFPPVLWGRQTRVVGQSNNAFIFPGVGLGAIAAGVMEISDEMFLTAARELAGHVTADRLATGALYPPVSALREVSRSIAVAVAAAGTGEDREQMSAVIDAFMWRPEYAVLH
ncbi:MAG: NAD-dependent malic enzyme [Actinomycetota bacterium]